MTEVATFTIGETAKYLNLPLTKIYELVKKPGFPATKFGGKEWRILMRKLDQWLDRQF